MGILDNINFAGGWLSPALARPRELGMMEQFGLVPPQEQSPFAGLDQRQRPAPNMMASTPPVMADPFSQPGAFAPPPQAPTPQSSLPTIPPPVTPDAAQAMAYAPQPVNRAGLDEYIYNVRQPTPPQGGPAAPQAQQPNGPGITDWLGNNANTLMMLGAGIAGGKNWGEGISAGLQGAMAGGRADRQARNQFATAQAVAQSLIARGYNPNEAWGMAQAAAIDPKVAEKVLGDAYSRAKSPEEYLARQMEKSDRTGGSAGGANQYYDYVRNKNAAEKSGTVEGERVATAAIDLPSAVAAANEQLRLIEDLRKHPGRGQIGWHDVLGASPLVPSTKGYDAQVILDQIKGGAFLEAFKSLKGGGQITEVEGKKATAAIARMDRATSRAEFDKALSDYEGVIRLGIDRANQQAGKKPPYEFKGNSEWQQVKPGVRIRQVQ